MSKNSKTDAAWKAQRLRILARDQWRCQYCGVALDGEHNSPTSATVDHIDAVALDPTRVYRDEDLVACCRRENGRKSDRALLRTDWFAEAWFPGGKVPV